MSSGQHDLFCMTSIPFCEALKSLNWIPLAGLKEKRNF